LIKIYPQDTIINKTINLSFDMFALKEDKHLINGLDGMDGMDGLAVMENPDFENEEMNHHHDWMYEMTSFQNHIQEEDEEETFSQYNLMLENADDFDFKVDDLEDFELDLDNIDNIDNIDNTSEVLSTVSTITTSTTLTLTANKKKEDTNISYPLYPRYTRDDRDFKTRLWDEHLATKRYRERILDRRRMDYEFHKKYEKFLEDYFKEEEEEMGDEIYTKEPSSEKIDEEERPIEWTVLSYRMENEEGCVRYVETEAKEEIKIDNETTQEETNNKSPPLSPSRPSPPPCVWKKIETKVVPLSFDVPPTVIPEPSPSPPPPPSPSLSSSTHSSHPKNYKNNQNQNKNHPPHSRRQQHGTHRSSHTNVMEKEEEVVVVPTKLYPRLCKHGRYCKRNQTDEKCNMAHTLVEWDPSCQRGTKCNRGKNCMYWHEETNKETKQQYLSRMIHDVPNNYFSGITSYEKVYVHSSRPQKK